MSLKNIDFWTLITSKTFRAGLTAFGGGMIHAYAQWAGGSKVQGISEALLSIAALLAAERH